MGWSDFNVWGRRAVAAATAGALLAGGYGGYVWVKERSPGDRLAEACGGMLPVDEVLALTGATASGFGGRDLELTSDTYDVSESVREPGAIPTTCRANTLNVRIETAGGSRSAFDTYTFHRNDAPLPIPLPAGWSGFLVPEDEEEIGVSVLLDCPEWDRREGAGILVNVERYDTDSSDASVRAQVARVATGAAERAAQRTGCGGEPGGRITEVDSTAGTPSPADTERADGTCQGMTSHPRMQETAARTAPVESCLLTDALLLRSYYGPFVRGEGEGRFGAWERASGVTGFTAWGSAECRGALGTAVYALRPVKDSDRSFDSAPPTRSEYADLRRFAEASAERHHCSSLTLPAGPRG
ncbi:hypothetical protein [Streptomonospora arabica]|uniref:Aromatic ring-opening dioxygenase LigA n=1 Tax=Streptomonospora arabica TaxID=412417 RepID=A0ABV9ST50_9ACTN